MEFLLVSLAFSAGFLCGTFWASRPRDEDDLNGR